MRWAVAGHPRTGSSALVRLLVDHGMTVVARTSATPYPARVFELPAGWPAHPMRRFCDGRLVKVFWRDLVRCDDPAFWDGFEVVRLVRDPAEVVASWRARGADVSEADVVERFEVVRERWPSAPEVDQATLRDAPAWVVGLLRDHGWPLTREPVGGMVVDRVLVRDRAGGYGVRETSIVAM